MDEIREAIVNDMNAELAIRMCIRLATDGEAWAECHVQYMSVDNRDAIVGYISFAMWADDPYYGFSLDKIMEDYRERTKKSE